MKKLLLVGALVAPVSLWAQEKAQDFSNLLTIDVVAARAESDAKLASVTVITREDLERTQSRSVQDALRGIPGLNVANSGGAGKATSVFLRGSNADHVLVLIDGVPQGSATLGTTSFQDLPIEQIEKIEVIRGPRSSLYGSQALGGVIQITTRSGSGPLSGSAFAGAGTDNSWRVGAAASGGLGNASFAASVSTQDTQGFNACTVPPGIFSGCSTQEPDRDGYTNLGGTLSAGYRFDSGASVDARWMRSDSENDFDGGSQNESDSTQEVLSLAATAPRIGPWQARVSGGRTEDLSENFSNSQFRSRFDSRRDSVSLTNSFSLAGDQLLVVGGDYQDDHVSSTTAYLLDSRANAGGYVQYLGGYADLDVEASLRHDDSEAYGDYLTGNIALGSPLPAGLRWKTSYGTAFKAPTFNQLYFPGFGDPSLIPEESESWEAGLSGKVLGTGWSVNGFRTEIDNLIETSRTSFTAVNVEKARIVGVETLLSGAILGLDYKAQYTWMNPRNRSRSQSTGDILARRARQSAQLDLDRSFGKLRAGTTVYAAGKRFDYDFSNNVYTLAGYMTLDARVSYRFLKNWEAQLRGENLLDKDYETAKFFNQQGVAGYVTLRYQFSNTGD